jgi:septum formation protein
LALILASGSSIRRKMLEDAGVEHIAVRPDVDESTLKSGRSGASEIAAKLAKAKAMAVSRSHPGEWVIGSDSIVSVADRLFDKPSDREEAAKHLRFFSGKSLILTSAVALAKDGVVDWSHAENAELAVRPLSDEFIEAYLQAEWPDVGYCVGVFRMEGRGVQLFERVEGSHFTILGMPLIPLLAALRERGALPS